MVEKINEFVHNSGTWLTTIFTLAASILGLLQGVHQVFPALVWVSGAVAVMSQIVQLGQSLGYNKRQAVEAAADAHVQAAQINAGAVAMQSASTSPK